MAFQSAALVSLHVRMPKKTGRDKAETEAIRQRTGASEASVVRSVMPAVYRKRFSAIENSARLIMNAYSLPWDEFRGTRICPSRPVQTQTGITTSIMLVQRRVGEKIREWNTTADLHAANDFRSQAYYDQCRDAMGTMFDPLALPSAEEYRRQFSMKLRFTPVPEASDISMRWWDAMRVEMEAEVEEQLKDARREPYRRTTQLLGEVVKRLQGKRLHDKSIAGALRQWADEANALLLTDDPEFLKVLDDVRAMAKTLDIDTMRENEPLRELRAKELQDQMARIDSKMRGIF